MPLTPSVALRPLRSGELAQDWPADSEFDDFGPRDAHLGPPCRLDGDGHLGVVADGRLVGTMSWTWVGWGPNEASRCPMIGIWLRADARGAGVGTQAQRDLVDLLFRHTATNRVQAHTDVTNGAEQRALAKAGFTAEGVVRGGQWRNGSWHDGRLYSILRSEWRADRAAAG
ncbi:GNAT family protein [Intrasporangium sp.]|uniref:GNAT family N-acetyltransferase n=1 Tax=Intrasporangium sp. TaxID=1925024 RepID=UPI0032217630